MKSANILGYEKRIPIYGTTFPSREHQASRAHSGQEREFSESNSARPPLGTTHKEYDRRKGESQSAILHPKTFCTRLPANPLDQYF